MIDRCALIAKIERQTAEDGAVAKEVLPWIDVARELLDELEQTKAHAERQADALDKAHIALGVVIAQEKTGRDKGTYAEVHKAFAAVGKALMRTPVPPKVQS